MRSDCPSLTPAGICTSTARASLPVAPEHVSHVSVLDVPALRDIGERWAALGAERSHSAPEQFAAFLKKDLGKWATVVRDSGAKID